IGRFFNSLHFWSVQLFFIFMVLHLWGQYFAAGWRDGRASTWMIGAVIFLVSIVTAFTGYLSQQNFDAQWIAINAKDAINSGGVVAGRGAGHQPERGSVSRGRPGRRRRKRAQRRRHPRWLSRARQRRLRRRSERRLLRAPGLRGRALSR